MWLPKINLPLHFPLELYCCFAKLLWSHASTYWIFTRLQRPVFLVCRLKKKKKESLHETTCGWQLSLAHLIAERGLLNDRFWIQSKQWNHSFKHVSGRDCEYTHANTRVLQQKSRWANLLPQQDQAGLLRQRLHRAETDAVEKYCCSSPLRQTQ